LISSNISSGGLDERPESDSNPLLIDNRQSGEVVNSDGTITASSEGMRVALENAIKRFENINLGRRGYSSSKAAMSLCKDKDGNTYITIPSNFEAHADSVIMSHWVALAVKLHFRVEVTPQVMEPFKQTRELLNFWSAFFATLRDDVKVDGEEISFRNTSDTALGVNSARLALWKASGTFDNGFMGFLPDKSLLIGKNRQEAVSFYGKLSIVNSDRTAHEAGLNQLKTLINLFARSRSDGWKPRYGLPLGDALKGLHRTKTIRVKGNQSKNEPIHPSRPSQRIEVFSEAEKDLIGRSEEPFDNYKKLLTDSAADQKVDIYKLKDFRAEAHKLINAMWEVVNRFTAPLTKRRQLVLANMPKRGKAINFTKNTWTDALELIKSRNDWKEIQSFSPRDIMSRYNTTDGITINSMDGFLKGSVTQATFENADWIQTPSWISFISFFGPGPKKKYGGLYAVLGIEDDVQGNTHQGEDNSFP
jgi:hypothetical protein